MKWYAFKIAVYKKQAFIVSPHCINGVTHGSPMIHRCIIKRRHNGSMQPTLYGITELPLLQRFIGENLEMM